MVKTSTTGLDRRRLAGRRQPTDGREARTGAKRRTAARPAGPFSLAMLLLALTGCASALPPQRPEVDFAERGGVDQAQRQVGLQVLTIPEGQRVMLIKGPDDVERVCSPRESDQGLSVSEGLSLSLPGAGGSVGVGETMGDQAVALGHPAAVVQLARELLFRACELSLNLDADPATTREIYERFLAVLETVGPSLTARVEEDEDDADDSSDDGD